MRRACVVLALLLSFPALAQTVGTTRAVEFQFTPRSRTQIAIWIERRDGTFLKTVALTQSVGLRGLGNRPGAAQMNSAYHWPYGRREGVLPIWAHRRAAAPDAMPFRRVIFQDRLSEGDASRTSEDSSPEAYYCLSFATTTASAMGELDAITCATSSQPQTDKGRYLSPADVAAGYAEPAELAGVGMMRVLNETSFYPPRMDVRPCMNCADRPDVVGYADDVRRIMPDIDAVTMATPAGEVERSVLFSIPADWEDGRYIAWIEVNVEGDYNATFNTTTYPAPSKPESAWDPWALTTGYAYRGQPSIVYSVPFTVGSAADFTAAVPVGYGDVDGFGPDGGVLHPMDGAITDDSGNPAARGSGADRLHLDSTGTYRFKVGMRGAESCAMHAPPAAPGGVTATRVADSKHQYEWGSLHLNVPTSDRSIHHYDVRYSSTEITTSEPTTFERAVPAVEASKEAPALVLPSEGAPGSAIDHDFGGMNPLTRYWIAVRAVDICNVSGPYAVAPPLDTTAIAFTKLAGCFVATAAYGSELEPRVQSLRQARDALLPRSSLFSIATDVYYRSGPAAAAVIARSAVARAIVRRLLAPMAEIAGAAFGAARPGRTNQQLFNRFMSWHNAGHAKSHSPE